MLSETLTNQLNEQINLEFYSSNLYLQMSTWCAYKGYDGCAEFLQQHSSEERTHMEKLFNYVHETGGLPKLGTIEAPEISWNSIKDVFEATYEHEKRITQRINALVKQSLAEEDFSTFNFLQWYVAEQHEEEHLFKSILDKIDLISTGERGSFFIDQELRKISQNRA